MCTNIKDQDGVYTGDNTDVANEEEIICSYPHLCKRFKRFIDAYGEDDWSEVNFFIGEQLMFLPAPSHS